MNITTIVFDLGNVLVRWNPATLYNKIFATEKDSHAFLNQVCTMDWHTMQDAGRSPAAGTEALVKEHPSWEPQIRAFYDRWEEMFSGPLEGTVQILKALKEKGYRLYALSNWNAELYRRTAGDYPFLNWFDGKIISGEEQMKKPDDEIYKLLLQRFRIQPGETLFIDDNQQNVEAAERLGIQSILFTTPEALEAALKAMKIL